jgi:putative transposase
MANSYHQIYIHTTFPVKYRQAVIEKEWKHSLFSVMGNLLNETGCKTLIVNGVYDHVHCFFSLKPSLSVSNIMKSVKAKSSKWVNEQELTPARFEWQKGFGAFSYSHSQIDRVFRYIKNQDEHHKHQSFQEEYIQLLKKFNVDFDDAYIFQELK